MFNFVCMFPVPNKLWGFMFYTVIMQSVLIYLSPEVKAVEFFPEGVLGEA